MVQMSGGVFVFGRFDLVEFVVAHRRFWIFVGSLAEDKGALYLGIQTARGYSRAIIVDMLYRSEPPIAPNRSHEPHSLFRP